MKSLSRNTLQTLNSLRNNQLDQTFSKQDLERDHTANFLDNINTD